MSFDPTPASDPALYSPGPQGAQAPPPGGQAPAPQAGAPEGPYVPPLELLATVLACAAVYLDRPAHDATFRSALAVLEAPALASVRAALGPAMAPQAVLAALQVCDFYGDFGGDLEDEFQDLLDEHADGLAGSIRRLAVGG